MPQSVLEFAKELTLALVATGNVPPEDLQETLQKTYATLSALKSQEEGGSTTAVPIAQTAPVDWRTSITRHAVICLECGDTFKQLSTRHLRMHGLDTRSYRTKYSIPPSVPLVARATTERRRQVVREIRPWEKAPRFIQAHARNGHRMPEPEVVIVPDEAEALTTAAASAQLKRQRKASPKKTVRTTTAQG
jgi:predicted transcriptional regulator